MSQEADDVCAFCGITAVDEIELKDCDDGCGLVKYCSDVCQDDHREQHDEECRKGRAELRDKDLFELPDESHLGDCPICFLPLPIVEDKCALMECCSKIICVGCAYANQVREIEEGLEKRCAFCREPVAKSQEEFYKNIMKRVKKNDPAAMCQMGKILDQEGDYKSAFEYYIKAAELGDADAHY